MSLDGIFGREGEYVTCFRDVAKGQRYRIPWIGQSGRAAIKYPLLPERSAGEGQGGALVTLDASFTHSHPQSHGNGPAENGRRRMRKNVFFISRNLMHGNSQHLSLAQRLFFPSTGTHRAVGRFPRFFPGFWWT